MSTVLLIGLISGLVAVRDATVSEALDAAGAINQIDQSFELHGLQYVGHFSERGDCRTATGGSSYRDERERSGRIFCVNPNGEGGGDNGGGDNGGGDNGGGDNGGGDNGGGDNGGGDNGGGDNGGGDNGGGDNGGGDNGGGDNGGGDNGGERTLYWHWQQGVRGQPGHWTGPSAGRGHAGHERDVPATGPYAENPPTWDGPDGPPG